MDNNIFGDYKKDDNISEVKKLEPKKKYERLDFNKMSDQELIKYTKENGLFGKGAMEIRRHSQRLREVIEYKKLDKLIISRKVQPKSLFRYTREEITDYAISKELFGKSITEALDIDRDYTIEVLRRKLEKELFKV